MSIDVFRQAVMLADVFVGGQATTKGSMESKGRGVMVDKPATYKRMALVRERLESDMGKRDLVVYPWAGRVGVRIQTWLQMPGAFNEAKARLWLLSDKSGDSDKHARLVLDALGPKWAGLIADDGQVAHLEAYKRMARPGMMAGQQITVWALGEDMAW